MSTVADVIGGSGFMSECGTVARLRAGRKADPYDPARTNADWTEPERVEMPGFIAAGTSSEAGDAARLETQSAATLTIPDSSADVRPGDRFETVPADGRLWRVVGFPARDRSPFTGWSPTTVCDLEEVRG